MTITADSFEMLNAVNRCQLAELKKAGTELDRIRINSRGRTQKSRDALENNGGFLRLRLDCFKRFEGEISKLWNFTAL
jgi:hypothetical protein